MKINKLFTIIIGVIIIGLILYVGYLQVQHFRQVKEYCDNKYGVDNWEMNETTNRTTATGKYKFYIGQVWECVPLLNNSDDKEINICSTIQGTPAWVDSNGTIIYYGILNSGFANNETIINDTTLTEWLIEDRIKFVYNENCGYCQIQKQMFGDDNFNKLKKEGLTLECG